MNSIAHTPQPMKTHTDYLIFNTKQRQQIIDITDKVEECRASADIDDGMVLVSAMHISASVFVNDHEPNLWQDILQWLENDIAPGNTEIGGTIFHVCWNVGRLNQKETEAPIG